MTAPIIRHLVLDDYERVTAVVDDWWGGRPMRAMLPRLFFEHFNSTSFVIGQDELLAFLIGFVSQSQPSLAYIHFVGVNPATRSKGLGRGLYERFFDLAKTMNCAQVECITSPVNTGSIAFHRKMGFILLPGTGEIDGVPVTLHHAGEGQHRVRFQKTI